MALILGIVEALAAEHVSQVRIATRAQNLHTVTVGVGDLHTRRTRKIEVMQHMEQGLMSDSSCMQGHVSHGSSKLASKSRTSLMAPGRPSQNSGHPHPLSNFVALEYSGASHALQL